MSWKHLFARSLAANPNHFAAHSHHLWPDASFDGQVEAWTDAARLADRKWDRIMGEVWPEAQCHVARELGTPDPATIVFAPNTHDLLVRIASAIESRPIRILTSDGEFHSFRRQVARWVEAGDATVEQILVEPGFENAFAAESRTGKYDLVWISHVMFNSGTVLRDLAALAAPPARTIVVIDGYHAFMALPVDLAALSDRVFYLGGGYKYAMAGEGVAFAHCPAGHAERPVVTGWYAEFDDLSCPPGGVGYAPDARRLLGATFNSSGLYRFNAVRRMLDDEGLSTSIISEHVATLQARAIYALAATGIGTMTLLNPLDGETHARFLAFRSSYAAATHAGLAAAGFTTDVRGDVLRIGFGLYHDASDVDRLAVTARELRI